MFQSIITILLLLTPNLLLLTPKLGFHLLAHLVLFLLAFEEYNWSHSHQRVLIPTLLGFPF